MYTVASWQLAVPHSAQLTLRTSIRWPRNQVPKAWEGNGTQELSKPTKYKA